MRLRFAVLASLLTTVTALAAVAVPSAASAAPKHNEGLTINATPQRIIAGEGVLIYGQLNGTDVAGQTIRLYHRVNPSPRFSLVGTTTTDAHGFYEFTRAEGVVLTDRSWFVRGPQHTHSRTVHELVSALVSVSADTTTGNTLHKVVFTGHISPNHRFERVLLQQRVVADDWRTIDSGFTGGASNYRIVHRWATAGARDVRVVFPGDRRNVRSYSDVLTLTIQQTQRPYFSINSSSPVISYGQATTISGVLDKPGTSTPDSGVVVALFAKPAGAQHYQALATAVTGADGSYSFTQAPTSNTIYVVKTEFDASRHSAYLFEAVKDVVSAMPSATSAPVGTHVTFTGTVLPGKTGAVVYLQQLGKDGDWHTVAVGLTNQLSSYSIAWTLGDTGSQTFRTRVLGDRANWGGISPTMTIDVTPATALGALAPAF